MATPYTALAEEIKQAASALPPDKQIYFLGYVTAMADIIFPQPQPQPAAQDVKV